ncbi:SMC-Scp complex subunit ScpB, partial [Couchioplanes caeruleus]
AGSDVPEAEAAGSDVPEAEAAGSDVPEAEDSELEGEVASGVTGGEAASELLIDGEVAAEPVDAEVPAEAASEPVDGGDESGADGEAVALSAPSSGIPAQGRRGRDGGAASGESSPRTEEVELKPAEEPALKALDDGELRAALEAILLVVDEPVAEMQLAQIVEQATERVAAMLEDISARYTAAGHGFDLRRAAGGWRLYTRPEYAPYVERFVLDGQSVRLTQAALETLAVVAYKQPVTRSRISAIRGVNCDGVMRTLVTRGLIEECGTEGETGAFLYRTTALFLEKLGLNSVDQLPPLAPFLPDDVEEVLDASG